MPFVPDLDEITAAAEALIRAEWEFRAGRLAYHLSTQDWYENALGDLRKAVTGETDLGRAASVLGKCPQKPEQPRRRLKVDLSEKPLVRKRLSGGFFEEV